MRNILVEKYNNVTIKLSNQTDILTITIICVCVYKFNLDFIYCFFIGDHYGSFYITTSPINIINGWLITVIMAYVIDIYNKQKTCSAIMMIALNIIYFIPITTYCGYGGGSSGFLFFTCLYWAFLSILQCKIPFITHKRKKMEMSQYGFYTMLFIVTLITLYFWLKYVHFRITINLFDVYDIREKAANYDVPQLFQYIRAAANIMLAMLIVLALNMKKYISIIWLLVLTLLAFSFAGDKSVILFPILLIGGYVFYEKNIISLIFPLSIGVQLIAALEWILVGSKYIVSLVFYRTLMVPAELSDFYYRFFNEHSIDLFRNGIMGKLGFESCYSQIIPNVIGNNFESQTINCNNGLLADVWANIGIVGIIVMPIILIICFRLLDFVTYGVDVKMSIGIVLFFAICFVNMSWSTVLLTKGYLIVCILFLFFPIEKKRLHGGEA